MISIIVPSYDPEGRKREMLLDVLEGIDKNTQGVEYELIIRKNGPSYTESHNDAFATARGDYFYIVTDDVVIDDPDWLDKMTHENAISAWRFTQFYLTGDMRPDFSLWSMSREVYNKLGGFDLAYKNGFGFEDDDYIARAVQAGVALVDADVNAVHQEALTQKLYYPDYADLFNNNKDIYTAKWLK